MLSYHGILAPATSWREHVVPASPPPRTTRCQRSQQPTASVARRSTRSQRLSDQHLSDAEPPTRRQERLPWAELLRRAYATEVLVCEEGGARRELTAFLTALDVIRRILEHLGLPTRPPPIRQSPAALFEFN
jgi:hypothetical protein